MAKTAWEREDDKRVMALFRGRCVKCMKSAQHVHEIIPRARTKEATRLSKNRVPLCIECHRMVHDIGVNEYTVLKLTELARTRLLAFGEDLEKW